MNSYFSLKATLLFTEYPQHCILFPRFAGRLHQDSPCSHRTLFRSFRWVTLCRSWLLGPFPRPRNLNNHSSDLSLQELAEWLEKTNVIILPSAFGNNKKCTHRGSSSGEDHLLHTRKALGSVPIILFTYLFVCLLYWTNKNK